MLNTWQKYWEYKKALRSFRKAYHGLKPFQCAVAARQAIGRQDDPSLLYGEVLFEPFWDLIQSLPIANAGDFIDLGSGSGKAVMTAALSKRFDESVGVELLEPLYQLSLEAFSRLDNLIHYRLVCGNWLECDLSSASVVFINATGLFSEALETLVNILEGLSTGAIVIITTKTLSSERFVCLSTQSIEMSWGFATTSVYQKIGPFCD